MDVKELSYIASLIEKHLRGNLTVAEQEELDLWLNHSEKNRKMFGRICSGKFLEEERQRELWFDEGKAWEHFVREAGFCSGSSRRKHFFSAYRWYVAAVAVLLIGSSVLMWQISGREQVAQTSLLAAGSPLARLTLANGQVMELSGKLRDTLVQGNARLVTDGESVTYQAGEKDGTEIFNQLEVPRKGEFFLLLSDGTRVWLNSETTLHYPVCFTGSERRVEVVGEAYFEVRRDSLRPFRVELVGRGTVEVTGTAFNVHHYPDEANTLVTLAEGRVNLFCGPDSLRIQAGEQGCMEEGRLEKKTVNTHLYTAWKDGRFVFKEQPLEEIMQTLARWYDADIEFADEEVRQVTFSGNLQRYDDFGKIIRMLEAIRVARFEVQGNHIRVFIYKKAG